MPKIMRYLGVQYIDKSVHSKSKCRYYVLFQIYYTENITIISQRGKDEE